MILKILLVVFGSAVDAYPLIQAAGMLIALVAMVWYDFWAVSCERVLAAVRGHLSVRLQQPHNQPGLIHRLLSHTGPMSPATAWAVPTASMHPAAGTADVHCP
jgi:hypothetical protein